MKGLCACLHRTQDSLIKICRTFSFFAEREGKIEMQHMHASRAFQIEARCSSLAYIDQPLQISSHVDRPCYVGGRNFNCLGGSNVATSSIESIVAD